LFFFITVKNLIDSTVQKIESERPGETLAAFIDRKQAKTDLQVRNATHDFIYFNTEELENNHFEYGLFQFELSVCQAVDLLPRIKSNFVECPKNKVVEKRNAFDKTRSIDNQNEVEKYRRIYQLTYWGSEETSIKAKNDLIKQYKKAGASDLIRLCWKYITNPATIEGVNVPYIEEPKVVFTPYSEMETVPEFVKNTYLKNEVIEPTPSNEKTLIQNSYEIT